MQLLNVEKYALAIRLGSLLTGKAAELYSMFDTTTISDFSILKQALLTSFNETLDCYWQDFENNRIWVSEKC